LEDKDEETDDESTEVEAETNTYPQSKPAIWGKSKVVSQESVFDEKMHGGIVYREDVDVL
jgi:hypothetical protein